LNWTVSWERSEPDIGDELKYTAGYPSWLEN
jgi:hypothetical protein